MAEHRQVTVQQAAKVLNVSPDTIRRRIRDGKLKADKVDGRWEVELPPTETMQRNYATRQGDYVGALLDRIKSLEAELEARRMEVLQLHALLSRPQLPGPSWWQRLFRR